MSGPNNFTTSMATVISSLEDRIRYGVEQPAQTPAFIFFKKDVTAYPLPPGAYGITGVTGKVKNQFTIFEEFRDYGFSEGSLVWLGQRVPPAEGARLPDLDSRVDIEYTVRGLPSGLTDFNPGSVLDTLVRAVAREMTLLYAQMDQAYRRAFIDEASGVALENVVALLGVTRKPASRAKGSATFSRKTAADKDIDIPAGTRIATKGGQVFVTVQKTTIGRGSTSATVDIVAAEPGPDGNLRENEINLMPTPVPGVDGVTNPDPTSDGAPAESDERLRDRTKHYLEQAGNATTNAIKYSVLGVDGVQLVEVLDHFADETIPLGEVRVRYTGGDKDRVRTVVENTRAAGILARIDEIVQVSISGVFYLIPTDQPSPAAGQAFINLAVNAINGLSIGAPLSIRRLNSLAFGVAGLQDVAEAQLQSHKPKPSDPGKDIDSKSDFVVLNTELIRSSPELLKYAFLQRLNVTAHAGRAGAYTINLQILDSQGAAVTFRSFPIELKIRAASVLKKNPSQAPVPVGTFSKSVTFTGATAQLTISVKDDLKEFRPDDHGPEVRFAISAAAYPGLQEARTSFEVTP